MKLLLLTTSNQLQDNSLRDRLLGEVCGVRVVALTGRQQKRLWWHLRGVDFSRYDAVLTNLQIKHFSKQLRFMRKIPNLFCYELDACQNYIPASKWYGAYSEFFGKHLPTAAVLCTGFTVAKKLAAEGIKAHYVPKGYDHEQVRVLTTPQQEAQQGAQPKAQQATPRGTPQEAQQSAPQEAQRPTQQVGAQKQALQKRDIDLGFIGRLEHPVYAERRVFLESLRDSHGLQILRTAPGSKYVKTLNRIRFFVTADIGLGEHMAKNFEAMAAGCIVCAYRQGQDEENALGLVDMQNIVLYSSKQELLDKLAALTNSPDKCAAIQQAAVAHARENLSYAAQVRAIIECMSVHRGS